MPRKKRININDGMRFCHRCDKEFPLTEQFFCRDKSRKFGLGYDCKPCHNKRHIGKDGRIARWFDLTPEQKAIKIIKTREWGRTLKGRAVKLRVAYARVDSCDLTSDEIVKIISGPCTYCGTIERGRGLDRIDNKKDHIKGNVVSCCYECNTARGDRFSMEEMKLIGNTIRDIFKNRTQNLIPNDLGLACGTNLHK